MSAATQVQKAKLNAVVNYEEELAAEAAKMKAMIGAPSGDLIRIGKDKKSFVMPDGATAEALDVIVASFVSMNQYYEGKYDSKNIQPPKCMALGQEIKLMKPFDDVPDKQNDDCETCAQNQWGSDGKGKACKNQRMLALLSPKAQTDGPLMLIKVSPTGTKFWDNYVIQVQQKVGALIKVVTRISLDPNSEWASLRFSIAGLNENWQEAFPKRATALERLLMKPDFGPKTKK